LPFLSDSNLAWLHAQQRSELLFPCVSSWMFSLVERCLARDQAYSSDLDSPFLQGLNIPNYDKHN